MNAVEIEEAISELALQPFDAKEFPFAFLEAFGNKATTIKRLRNGNTNNSKINGGVLQRNNIHLATCKQGEVESTLTQLRESPNTSKAKAKIILSTDGIDFQAEDMKSGETIACKYSDFHEYFGFFLQLAGISTVKQIRENAFDIKATSRLNKLYVELLKHNPDWATLERRHDMNHFMARLIFCFFAEDTNIFLGDNLFSDTVRQMSTSDASNTNEVISELFKAMDTKKTDRERLKIKSWANPFPYVNGQLFSGSTEVPKFTKIARSYLIHVGNLDWKKINPDIFGSMIQAVADIDERGNLGMHYTSVPNILKLLNPLFLDDLRSQLKEANGNPRKLLNLRKRIARIRIFDPACGSGNFLVIAYKEMRAIENEINILRNETARKSEIPLTNFRGIELKDFSAQVARLALIIAEFQCDELYLGQQLALAEFLPLNSENWITHGNALKLNWLSVCPPTGTGVKLHADDLFSTPLNQAEIDFKNEGGETYICGNPPYKGTKNQTKFEKLDLKEVFINYTKRSGSLDYVAGWFIKASEYILQTNADYAFVTTNSICQGGQVPVLWPILYNLNSDIKFAYHSFKWSNLASDNAGVTVIIVGVTVNKKNKRQIFHTDKTKNTTSKEVQFIGPYLIANTKTIIKGRTRPLSNLINMQLGNAPYDGGNLIINKFKLDIALNGHEQKIWLRDFWGSTEIINKIPRKCFWIEDDSLKEALKVSEIKNRIHKVNIMRTSSKDSGTQKMALRSHQFREMNYGTSNTIAVPIRSSESRPYLPVDLLGPNCCISNLAYAIYDGPLFNLAIIGSKLHLVWIATVCGRLELRFSYSNKMGWHTFPLPMLTEKNKKDLTKCAEEILIARENHFPKSLAELYDPDNIPEDLLRAHLRNDEILERIYIGRKFKNDTERLDKLFDMYNHMINKDLDK